MSWRLRKGEIFESSFPAGELLLFAFPPEGAKALLSLSEVLTYDATWIDESGKRAPLTDGERAIIEATRTALAIEVEQVNLIVAKLEEIRYEIELLRTSQQPQETIEDELTGIVTTLTEIGLILGV